MISYHLPLCKEDKKSLRKILTKVSKNPEKEKKYTTKGGMILFPSCMTMNGKPYKIYLFTSGGYNVATLSL